MAMMDLPQIFDHKEYTLGKKFPSSESRESILKLECKSYGFDCSFTVTGMIEKIIKKFREHTFQQHYIDYPEGVVMSFIKRKYHFSY